MDCVEAVSGWSVAVMASVATTLGFKEAVDQERHNPKTETKIYHTLSVIFFFVHIIDMSLDWSLVFDLFSRDYDLISNDDPRDPNHKLASVMMGIYLILGIILGFVVDVRLKLFQQQKQDPSVGAICVAELLVFGVEDCATIYTFMLFYGVYTEDKFLDQFNLALSCFHGLFFVTVLWIYIPYRLCKKDLVGCAGYTVLLFNTFLAIYATWLAVNFVARLSENEVGYAPDDRENLDASDKAMLLGIPFLLAILVWIWVMCRWEKVFKWTLVRDVQVDAAVRSNSLPRFFWLSWAFVISISVLTGYLISLRTEPTVKQYTFDWNYGGSVGGSTESEGLGMRLGINANGTRFVTSSSSISSSVRVFWRASNGWSQCGPELPIVEPGSQEEFITQNVAINAVGNVVAYSVGSTNTSNYTGFVRIMTFNDENFQWVPLGNDIVGGSGEMLGYEVKLGQEKLCVAVGGVYSSGNIGFVRFLEFEYETNEWLMQAQITSEVPNDQIETIFDINGDCTKAVVGSVASLHKYAGNIYLRGINESAHRGNVHSYTLDASTNTWNEDGTVASFEEVAKVSIAMTENQKFSHVAMGLFGFNYSVVSYNRYTYAAIYSNITQGAVRVFKRSLAEGDDDWIQLGNDIVGFGESNFGATIALDANATRVVFGSRMYRTLSPPLYGEANIYELDENETWIYMDGMGGNEKYNRLGEDAVAISANGEVWAVGEPRADYLGGFRHHPEDGLKDQGQVSVMEWDFWSLSGY